MLTSFVPMWKSCLLLAVYTSLATSRPAADDWSLQEWDVIVVGAGTAGIIVADKFSEAGLSTLLLEAGSVSYGITGGTERPEWLSSTDLSRVDVPGLYKSIFAGNTSLTCSSAMVNAFQACTVGGNSAINAGLYFQPPASDWDDYHPDGWHSSDVEGAVGRLLKRLGTVESYSMDGQYYLQSGYEAAHEWIVKGAGFNNVSIAQQPNDKEKVFGRPVFDYINGQRGGPVRTYLQTALARSNFHLQTSVRVRYIERDCGKASGVVATVSGSEVTVKLSSKGRVILSAGALLSPQILMYSGIGPEDILRKLSDASHTPFDSSKWIVNPAVGKGLFDNPNTFIELSGPSVESYVYDYENPPTQDRDDYLALRSGPYSFASQTSVFWDYVKHADGSRAGVQGTIDSAGFSDFMGNNTITLNVYGTSGLASTGSVVLSGENFTAGPSGDVYYSNPRDAEDIATFIHSIFQALPPSTPQSPATKGLTPLNLARDSTVEEIQKYITTPSAYAVGSVQHWSSSCRIGSCVGVDTKVMGTENIHVIDASILSPLTVNPQFGVMVAAEKGVENILATGTNKGVNLDIDKSLNSRLRRGS